MFFRFACALALVVGVSLAGVALEKHNLRLRRELSRQSYRVDVLRERHAGLRLRTEQLGAPARMLQSLEAGSSRLRSVERTADSGAVAPPLLHLSPNVTTGPGIRE